MRSGKEKYLQRRSTASVIELRVERGNVNTYSKKINTSTQYVYAVSTKGEERKQIVSTLGWCLNIQKGEGALYGGRKGGVRDGKEGGG